MALERAGGGGVRVLCLGARRLESFDRTPFPLICGETRSTYHRGKLSPRPAFFAPIDGQVLRGRIKEPGAKPISVLARSSFSLLTSAAPSSSPERPSLLLHKARHHDLLTPLSSPETPCLPLDRVSSGSPTSPPPMLLSPRRRPSSTARYVAAPCDARHATHPPLQTAIIATIGAHASLQPARGTPLTPSCRPQGQQPRKARRARARGCQHRCVLCPSAPKGGSLTRAGPASAHELLARRV